MPKHQEEPRNVVAIIQARMGSRRFPGKVLADLAGRPVLEWVVDAVRRVEGVDHIVVATTTNVEDGAIERWCDESGVDCFRGEPLDVLKRYADCARNYRATHVLRITADCPMLDSEIVSVVLNEGLTAGTDYFSLGGGFPDGFDCEGFTSTALYKADALAGRSSQREHVTPYLKEPGAGFAAHYVTLPSEVEGLRLTVDCPEDLDFLRVLLDAMGESVGPLPLDGIVKILEEKPEIRKINSHILRNEGYLMSLQDESKSAEFQSGQTNRD